MPQQAVGGLQDPVVLVREEHEPALDALALQCGEGREALRVRHPVVERAVDDEHRRLPLRHMISRVELLMHLRVGVVGAAVLPFSEPQLLGGVVHRALVEDSGVVDDALEPVRPVAGDPVLHEAAIRCAE